MYSVPGIKAAVSEEEYKDKKKTCPAGTYLLLYGTYSKQLQNRLAPCRSYDAIDALPGVKTHSLAQPRIAILHTWISTRSRKAGTGLHSRV